MNDRPLDGIRVVAFTQFLLGPAACQYLCDLGAEVVKVESPHGGAFERNWSGANCFISGQSVFFMSTHKNAKSVAIDLKAARGREAALRLIASSDVLVENFRPGAMDRLGLGYAEAQQANGKIIYASASGYGVDGPGRDLPGQDLLLQAVSGLAASTGTSPQTPTPAGAAVVDQHAASLLALAITAALLRRERTGEGGALHVTMLDAALDLQLEGLTYFMNGASLTRPDRAVGSSFHQAPYGIYSTADGFLAISLSPLAALFGALGQPESLAPFLDEGVDLLEARDEVRDRVQALLLADDAASWTDRLRASGVWCAVVNSYSDLLSDPLVQHADPIDVVEHPKAGTIRLLRSPFARSYPPPSPALSPPQLGDHTTEVLSAAGYSEAEIVELRHMGVVGAAP